MAKKKYTKIYKQTMIVESVSLIACFISILNQYANGVFVFYLLSIALLFILIMLEMAGWKYEDS